MPTFPRGVAYYPEFWPEDLWDTDLALMRDAGINAVRIAEFAWSQLEPEDGRFDLDWLDRFLTLARRRDIAVLLCTPTATPPKWVGQRYPDSRVITPAGDPVDPWTRKHYCPLSPDYRCLTERVLRRMADVAATHDHILAWQIDNEMGPHEVGRCFCPTCSAAWIDWLRTRYRTLDALNAAWQTGHWSQVITDWDQLIPPANKSQPAISLDFARFGQSTWEACCTLQRDTLRDAGVTAPISTNFMAPIYEAMDYWQFAPLTDLTFMDAYVQGIAPEAAALGSDLTRCLKHQPFWITETGTNAHATATAADTPGGELRVFAWRFIARGARGLFYFRWRTCLSGAEDRHPSLLTHSRELTAGYHQAAAIFSEIDRLAPQLDALPLPAPQVAVVFDWQAMLARSVPWTYMTPGIAAIEKQLLDVYHVLARLGITCDVTPTTADLSRYQLVIIPGAAATLMTDAGAAHVRRFVEHGGTLLATADFFSRDTHNTRLAAPRPLQLTDVLGMHVAESRVISAPGSHVWARNAADAPEHNLRFTDGRVLQLTTPNLLESLTASSAQPLATHDGLVHGGSVAATLHRFGQGHAAYLGAVPTQPVLRSMLDTLIPLAKIDTLPASPGVETIRTGPHTFLLNTTPGALPCPDLGPGRWHLDRLTPTGHLPPYAVVWHQT